MGYVRIVEPIVFWKAAPITATNMGRIPGTLLETGVCEVEVGATCTAAGVADKGAVLGFIDAVAIS
jgi:hypothetical protein